MMRRFFTLSLMIALAWVSTSAEHLFKVGDSEYATIETLNVGATYAWDLGTAKAWSSTLSTLTIAQWQYLLAQTDNCKLAKVGGQKARGVVLYPTDWVGEKPGNRTDYTVEIDDWAALEAKGARFIPATTNIEQPQASGTYWTASEEGDYGDAFLFSTSSIGGKSAVSKSSIFPVREAQISESCNCFTVTF